MRVSTLFNSLILLVLLIFLGASLHYPTQLKFLPWLYIFIAIILGIVQIFKPNSKLGADEDEAQGVMLGELISNLKGNDRVYLKAIAWILGFLFFLYFLGFLVTVPVFTILYLKNNGESWKFSIGLSLVGWGIFFATFIYALQVRIYEGLLYQLLFSQ